MRRSAGVTNSDNHLARVICDRGRDGMNPGQASWHQPPISHRWSLPAPSSHTQRTNPPLHVPLTPWGTPVPVVEVEARKQEKRDSSGSPSPKIQRKSFSEKIRSGERRRRRRRRSRSPRRSRSRSPTPERMRRQGMWHRPVFTEDGSLDFDSSDEERSLGGESQQPDQKQDQGELGAMKPTFGAAALSGLAKYMKAEDLEKFNHQAKGIDVEKKLTSSNKGMQMLKKMGWNEGKGLGKSEHGIVNPVKATLRRKGAGIGAVDDPSRPSPDDDNYTLYQKRMWG
ncbi:hypothetical protein AAMO2058_000513500 [Amorphochlora amoebiformis]